MSTNKHTALPFGGPLTSAAMESPLGQLDAAIVAVEDALAQTALPITTTDATAAAGQKVVPVAATDGFLVGQSVWIGDVAGTFEIGVIASIQAGVSLTMVVNLTSTYAAGKIVSGSPAELVAARLTYASLAARLRATSGTIATSFPGSPATNDLCRRTDRGGALYIWTGTAWTQLDVPTVNAFWGTPSTDDRAYRVDLGMRFFYNGTRWLSEQLFSNSFGTLNSVSVVTDMERLATMAHISGISDLYIESIAAMDKPDAVTQSGSLYWTATYYKFDVSDAKTSIGSFNTQTDGLASFSQHRISVGAVLGGTSTYRGFLGAAVPTGAAGMLNLQSTIYYRYVAT